MFTPSYDSIGTVRLYDSIPSSDIALRLSFLEAMNSVETARQHEILRARRYHEGEHGTQLTTRLKEFLNDLYDTAGDEDPFRFNVSRNVVSAVAERLIVDGFDCDDLPTLEWVQKFWQQDGLDAKQEQVHEGALRDGEFFGIVDWDIAENRPTVIPYERYTSVDAGGSGQGCIIFYEEDDYNQHAQVGIKWWVEQTTNEIVERRNLYYPDHIEKWYRSNRAEWVLDGTIDWTDSTGAPLGIAVVHFRNKDLRPEACDAWAMQRAINKSLLDLLAASDLTAFRIYVSLGFIPTTDGGPLKSDRSNLLPIEPGTVVGTTLPPQQASFVAVDASELNPLMDLTHQLLLWLATATNTPVSRFISTKLIASDETLKEQEGPLLSRVRSRQTSFGNSWGKCLQLAVRLQNTFGTTEGTVLREDQTFDPIWAEAQSRSTQERLDLLLKKKMLEIPIKQLWKEAGYSSQRIADMEQLIAVQQQQALEQQAQMMKVRTPEEPDEEEDGRESEQEQDRNQD